MKRYSLILLFIFVGCARVPHEPQHPLVISEDRRPTEATPTYIIEYLAMYNAEETPIYEMYFGVRNLETGENRIFQIKELYEMATALRNQLYAIATTYNLLVERMVEIHDHPMLGINLPELPEKLEFRWYIPVEETK